MIKNNISKYLIIIITDDDLNNIVINNPNDIGGCIERLSYYNSIIDIYGYKISLLFKISCFNTGKIK